MAWLKFQSVRVRSFSSLGGFERGWRGWLRGFSDYGVSRRLFHHHQCALVIAAYYGKLTGKGALSGKSASWK
jgi:hypothetical protein